MKKIIFLFSSITLLLSLMFAGINPGYAQTETKTPLPQTQLTQTAAPVSVTSPQDSTNKKQFTFSDLGYQEKLMVGPYSAISIYFSVPANWELIPGGNLSIRFTHTVSGASSISLGEGANRIHGSLLVMLNDKTIKTVFLDRVGEYDIDIPLTDLEALKSVEPNGEHQIRLILDASISCDYGDIQTTLLINPTSAITLEHQTITPIIDLALFPRPIYQPNSIIPSSTLVVIPDKPSIDEIQSALAVITGLGSQSDGTVSPVLKSASALTEKERAANNLIFIGNAKNFPVLAGLALPLPIESNKISLPSGEGDDGVIQMLVSPWNSANVLLMISGNSDLAVVKAAQAVSTGRVITSGRPDLSLVAAINAEKTGFPYVQDQTFGDLGYPTQTIGTLGENYFPIKFFISPEQAATTEATIDLVTSHSNLLNFDGTAVSVFLNGEIIGSEAFDKNIGQVSQANIKILPNILRPGENELEIYTNLVPIYNCFSVDLTSSWMTISDTSTLHIPAATETTAAIIYDKTLKDYPNLYFADPTMKDLAFVLAKDDPAAIEAAAKIAFYLGANGNTTFADLAAVFADDVPEQIRDEHNLIIIGRATTLPILQEINAQLPAPFGENSDQTNQDVMLVNYSLPPGVNVGYIQFLKSPWNPDKNILTVTGNTESGLPMAANALVTDSLQAQLTGNYAIINNAQVLTTNTRLGVSRDSLAGGIPSAITATPTPGLPQIPMMPEIKGQPGWLLPSFLATSGILLLIVIGFILRGLLKKPKAVPPLKESDDSGKNKPGQS